MDRCCYRQEMVHCTISACIYIDKQSSYSLAFISQVKEFDTLGDTGCYFISVFGQTIEFGYPPYLLL